MDGGSADGGAEHGGHDHGHDHGHNHGSHASGHKSVAQFLGLEGEGDGVEHGGHGESPSQTAVWNNAVNGLSLKKLFEGIVITPNFLLLMMFLGFTGWLGVIYWVRHNEPFANHVLGSHKAYAPTAHQDRYIVEGIKEALPIKTSANTGYIFQPGNMMPHNIPAPSPVLAPAQAAAQTAAAPQAMGQQPAYMTHPMHQSMRTFGLRDHQAQPQAAYGQVQPMGAPMPASMQQAPVGWSLSNHDFSQQSAHFMNEFGAPQAHYYTAVPTPSGTRIKMITSR